MKQKFGKSFILIPIGLFVMAGTFIVSRYTPLTDTEVGFAMGAGLGLIIVAFYRRRLNRS
jgi:hypothetical protein